MRKLLVLVLLLGGAAAGDDVTPEQRDAALVKALKYLDEKLWTLQDGGSPRRQYSLAVAGWAYLLVTDKGGRKLPARKRQLDRIRDELVRYAERVEDLYAKDDKRRKKKRRTPAGPPGFAAMRTAQYVWPLSQAAHFFAEAKARRKGGRAATTALKACVRVLEAAQQPNGGWGHDDASRPGMGLPPVQIPLPGGKKLDYPGTLLAASHCALGGLGAAHAALKLKKHAALDRGRAFFAASQDKGGTFPYDPSQKSDIEMPGPMDAISVARTSGAAFALFAAGAPHDDPVARKALAAVDGTPEAMSEGHGSATMALQYGALLARARGPRAWAEFRKIFFPRILAAQEEGGAFLCCCKHTSPGVTCDTKAIPGMPMGASYVEGNKVYVTAIHVLVLLLDRAEPKSLPDAPGPRGPVTGK